MRCHQSHRIQSTFLSIIAQDLQLNWYFYFLGVYKYNLQHPKVGKTQRIHPILSLWIIHHSQVKTLGSMVHKSSPILLKQYLQNLGTQPTLPLRIFFLDYKVCKDHFHSFWWILHSGRFFLFPSICQVYVSYSTLSLNLFGS